MPSAEISLSRYAQIFSREMQLVAWSLTSKSIALERCVYANHQILKSRSMPVILSVENYRCVYDGLSKRGVMIRSRFRYCIDYAVLLAA